MKKNLALILVAAMLLCMLSASFAFASTPSSQSPSGTDASNVSTTAGTDTIADKAVKVTEKTVSKANADASVTKTTTTTSTFADGTAVVTTKVETTAKDGTVTTTEATVATVSEAAAENAEKNDTFAILPIKAAEDQEIAVVLPEDASAVKVEVPTEAAASAGTVLVAVDADGNEKVIKTSVITEFGVAAILDSNVTVKVVDNSKSFIDIDGHWGQASIERAAALELVEGIGNDMYDPEADLTRGAFCTVVARYDDADLTGGDDWFDAGMDWAVENGVSDGTDPERAITREELVTMLYRYAGSPAVTGSLAAFTDADQLSDWAAKAMTWAVTTGIIEGMDDVTLDPKGTATRAQLATIMERYTENVVM